MNCVFVMLSQYFTFGFVLCFGGVRVQCAHASPILIYLSIYSILYNLNERRVIMSATRIYMMMLLQLHHLNHTNVTIMKMDRFHQLNVPMEMTQTATILTWATHLHQTIQVGDINYMSAI